MIRVQSDPFDAAVELAGFTELASKAGAVSAFVGLVRDHSSDGAVTKLELQHHARFTLKSVEAIGADAGERFDLQLLTIIHRYGVLAPGEAIVFVATAAEHRRAAIDAVDYVMDRLKTEAAFWKREHREDGSRWIEPRPEDHADRQRWQGAGHD